MKKECYLFLVSFVLFILAIQLVSAVWWNPISWFEKKVQLGPVTCNDTDGGQDIYLKGTLTYSSSKTYYFNDSCAYYNFTTSKYDLREYYCIGNQYSYARIPCGINGCSDGACIKNSCTQSWNCTNWGACTSGVQTRLCRDLNNCGNEIGKPSESQSCAMINGTLIINSTPSQADISIDGVRQGITPNTISLVQGNHIVNISKLGFSNNISTIFISSGLTQNLFVSLNPVCRAGTVKSCGWAGNPNWSYEIQTFEDCSNITTTKLCEDGCENGNCLTITCTDSDAGLNYTQNGTTIRSVTGGDSGGAEGVNDRCDGDNLTEFYCDNKTIKSVIYYCPYGCENGACKIRTPCEIAGGKCTSKIRGCGHYSNIEESCGDSNILCCSGIPSCGDGVCFKHSILDFSENESNCPQDCPNQICSDLINFVKNPENNRYSNGINWTSSWNNTEYGEIWVNGKKVAFNESRVAFSGDYHAGEKDSKYLYLYYIITVFDSNMNASEIINDLISSNVCIVKSRYLDGKENRYYICNMNLAYGDTDSSSSKKRIIWANKNILVSLDVYSGIKLSDEEILKINKEKINDFVANLQNNKADFIDDSLDFVLDYPENGEFIDSLRMCESSLNVPSSGSWFCKTQPAICPPHGKQERICQVWDFESNNYKTIKNSILCSPGICSGCYVARGWNNNLESQTCIPYGFRILFEKGESEEILLDEFFREEIEELNLNISISPEEDAIYFYLGKDLPENMRFIINGNEYGKEGDSFFAYVGKTYTIEILEGDRVVEKEIQISLDKLTYSEDLTKQKIKVTLLENFPTYCDIDGNLKEQKVKDWKGDWAPCQNNYECSSNICTGGECVEINDIINEAKGYKSLGTRILCRLAHLFNEDNYNQCIYNFLGDVSSSSASSSSSSGGGGGSSPPSMPTA